MLLSLVIIFIITIGVDVPVYADADDFWTRVLEDDTVEIWNYSGSDAEVIIPSEINGRTVSGIGYPGFGSNHSLKSIFVPAGISNINAEAFSDCAALENINVDINNPNYSSEDGVLFNKDKTELLGYPIGNDRKSYMIPDGVTTVNEYAFAYSLKLKNIRITAGVAYIHNSFNGSDGLESITVDEDSPYFSSQDGVLFNHDKTQILQYPVGNCREKYIIPESVGYIGYRAFYNCKNLKCITIPDKVTYIDFGAFAHCYGLTSITVPENVEYIESQAFMSCSGLTSIVIKNGVNQIRSGAFSNCCSLNAVTIPASVTYIGSLAFSNCTGLKTVTVLNPDCRFAACKNAIPPNASIHGFNNSTAQIYAQTYGRSFIAVDKYTVDALGGSIRVNANPGLRFGFSYDKTQFDGTENIEELGFLYSGTETDNLIPGAQDVYRITTENSIDHGDYVTFNLVFTKIPKTAFEHRISARAYIKVDGKYYYSDVLRRSFSDVANSVLTDDSVDQNTKDKINNILDNGM